MKNKIENSYWIELIAFDKDNIKGTVEDFIDRQRGKVDSIYLLLTSWDVCYFYDGLETEYVLSRNTCSYGGHQYSDEREIQPWTNWNLKTLIDVFHEHGVEVYLTVFANNSAVGWDGNVIKEKTLFEVAPEVCEFSVRMNLNWGSAHFIKRFKDGTYLEDAFTEKVQRPLIEYGFDGLHLADGTCHNRQRLIVGDYTDDLVDQFVTRTGIKLPAEYPLVCGTNKKLLQKRFKYIITNLRYEWAVFVSERFGEWTKKIVSAMHKIGKKVTMNNCWSLSPVEALFRFGIDYKLLAEAGIDKIMYEDGNSVAIQCWFGNEMELVEQSRWNTQYRFMEKQRSLKAYCPEISQVNMTSVHDTNEQWDIINNAPNEYRTAIARRSISYIWQEGKLIPCCDGSIFCLSDCIPKEQWDLIHKVVDNFDIGQPIASLGFTALFDDDIKSQVKDFIETRRPHAEHIHNDLQYHGLPITALADKKEILKSNGPILACAEGVRTAELKEYFEKTDRLLVIVGHKDVLSRKANATFKCGDFMLKVYNANGNVNKEYAGYVKASTYFDDPVRGNWPEESRHHKVNERLYKDAIAYINVQGQIPYLLRPYDIVNAKGQHSYAGDLKKGNTNLYLFKLGENHYRMVAINRENIFNQPIVKMPFKIKDAHVIGKPGWAKPTIKGEDILIFRVNNRSSEIVDITV